MMSSQWPCMCVRKFTCCVVSNDARMSLNVVVVADGVSKMKIKVANNIKI